jgi:alpha-ketoglutarate-dependent taurine dioxygenase
MSNIESLLKSLPKREVIAQSPAALIHQRELLPHFPIPVVLEPTIKDLDLVEWSRANSEYIKELLLQSRALLFRNCGIDSASRFHDFIRATSTGDLLEYKDRSTPRRELGGRVYTSTEYPPDQRIALHNEGTYWTRWPMQIYFFCLQPASSGGETPIADVRNVLRRLPATVVERFRSKRVLYIRNYNDGLGLTWQSVFQTEDKEDVAQYCASHEIEFEWKPGNRLRTRQVRNAIATHPVTGEDLWFNHAAFFHISSLDEEVRSSLLANFGEESMPYNTYYGDGSPIDPFDLDLIRASYRAETIAFPWLTGDVLLLDNMSVAHSRNSYVGSRQILTGMSNPYGLN